MKKDLFPTLGETVIGHFRVLKPPHFPNEAKCTTFLVKMSAICMRMNHFDIKG